MDITIRVQRLAAMFDNLLNEDINNADHAFILLVTKADGDMIGGNAAVLSNLAGDDVIEFLRLTIKNMSHANEAYQSSTEQDTPQTPS